MGIIGFSWSTIWFYRSIIWFKRSTIWFYRGSFGVKGRTAKVFWFASIWTKSSKRICLTNISIFGIFIIFTIFITQERPFLDKVHPHSNPSAKRSSNLQKISTCFGLQQYWIFLTQTRDSCCAYSLLICPNRTGKRRVTVSVSFLNSKARTWRTLTPVWPCRPSLKVTVNGVTAC